MTETLFDHGCADPFATRAGSRTSPRKGFWYAGPTYLRPGIFYSRKRVLIVPEWLGGVTETLFDHAVRRSS